MKKNHTIRIWITVIILIVLAGVYFIPKYFSNNTDQQIALDKGTSKQGKGASSSRALPVLVAPVVSQRVLDGIRSVGSLRAFEAVELAAEMSGKVSEILFDEGSQVEKGKVLLKINDDDLQAQLRRYQFQEKTMSEKLERQRILFQREAISQESFDAVQTEYNVLKADMELLEVKISRCVVRAPFSGITGFRNVSQGAYISPGMSITQLVDISKLRVEFSIPEKYNTLKLMGMNIFFTTEGSQVQNEAKIYAMEPQVDNKTHTLIIRALYNNSSMKLRPGMLARVVIPTTAIEEHLLVPSEAIIPSMEGKSVWVVKNGKAQSVNVSTGIRLEKLVEVTRGLAVGDSVIITGLMQIREGSPVKVTN